MSQPIFHPWYITHRILSFSALNGSIIQCKTKRGNIDLDVDRQTLTVLNEAPPIERETDNQYGRPYKDKSGKYGLRYRTFSAELRVFKAFN